MRRRECLLALLGASVPTGRLAPEAPVLRGVRYLWDRQGGDGGWHSTTYGLLKSGQSLTGFVLDSLLASGAGPTEGVRRALAFLERHTNAEGAVGRKNPSLDDYPNYATALAVRAFSRAGRPVPPRMVEYLRGQQFTEQNGWKRDDAPYGAWGMGGDRRTPPNPGHVDLSMTRHVLDALSAAGVPPTDAVFRKAAVFLDRCQNRDGGFFFSTVVLDANKAGEEGGRYRSYGTATADGILSLLAIGRKPGDQRVKAAARWLRANHRGDGAPGFVGPAYERWTRGLRYYYAAASAEAFALLGLPGDPTQAEMLRREQRSDGSWANPESLVKEDDPLIATGFALRALATRSSRVLL